MACCRIRRHACAQSPPGFPAAPAQAPCVCTHTGARQGCAALSPHEWPRHVSHSPSLIPQHTPHLAQLPASAQSLSAHQLGSVRALCAVCRCPFPCQPCACGVRRLAPAGYESPAPSLGTQRLARQLWCPPSRCTCLRNTCTPPTASLPLAQPHPARARPPARPLTRLPACPPILLLPACWLPWTSGSAGVAGVPVAGPACVPPRGRARRAPPAHMAIPPAAACASFSYSASAPASWCAACAWPPLHPAPPPSPHSTGSCVRPSWAPARSLAQPQRRSAAPDHRALCQPACNCARLLCDCTRPVRAHPAHQAQPTQSECRTPSAPRAAVPATARIKGSCASDPAWLQHNSTLLSRAASGTLWHTPSGHPASAAGARLVPAGQHTQATVLSEPTAMYSCAPAVRTPARPSWVACGTAPQAWRRSRPRHCRPFTYPALCARRAFSRGSAAEHTAVCHAYIPTGNLRDASPPFRLPRPACPELHL